MTAIKYPILAAALVLMTSGTLTTADALATGRISDPLNVVNVVAFETGMLGDVPALATLDAIVNPRTGEFEGSVRLDTPAGTERRHGFFRWLIKIIWKIKEYIRYGAAGNNSIYQLSGFEMAVGDVTRFDSGEFMTVSDSTSGGRNKSGSAGSFAMRDGDFEPDSPPVESRTTFFPAGRGMIDFVTHHSFQNGETAVSEGQIILQGATRNALRREVRSSLTFQEILIEDDNSDGIVSIIFSGVVEELGTASGPLRAEDADRDGTN